MGLQGRLFIARHGETIYNSVGRMQGDAVDTPLTRKGFAQADAMGKALALWLGTKQALHLFSSPSGRALQTLSIISEHLEQDWHATTRDARLQEINVGKWEARYYADIVAEQGPIMDPEAGLFTVQPPGGEWYDDIAKRLQSWIDDTASTRGDRLVIMHGISSRVLRGMLTNQPVDPRWRAPMGSRLPQGTLVMIGADGQERIIHEGTGS